MYSYSHQLDNNPTEFGFLYYVKGKKKKRNKSTKGWMRVIDEKEKEKYRQRK
jgi:hypothetical protein